MGALISDGDIGLSVDFFSYRVVKRFPEENFFVVNVFGFLIS